MYGALLKSIAEMFARFLTGGLLLVTTRFHMKLSAISRTLSVLVYVLNTLLRLLRRELHFITSAKNTNLNILKRSLESYVAHKGEEFKCPNNQTSALSTICF